MKTAKIITKIVSAITTVAMALSLFSPVASYAADAKLDMSGKTVTGYTVILTGGAFGTRKSSITIYNNSGNIIWLNAHKNNGSGSISPTSESYILSGKSMTFTVKASKGSAVSVDITFNSPYSGTSCKSTTSTKYCTIIGNKH